MKKLHLAIAALSTVALVTTGAGAWATSSAPAPTAGTDHGEFIRFEVNHHKKGMGPVKGGFKTFSQTSGKVDLKNLKTSKAAFTIDLTSIATGLPKRDGHLKSADFFNVAKFASAKLTVDKVRKSKAGHTARVTLELLGAKKSFDANFKVVKELKGGILIEGSATLNRRDFGVGGEPAKVNAADSVAVTVRLAVTTK